MTSSLYKDRLSRSHWYAHASFAIEVLRWRLFNCRQLALDDMACDAGKNYRGHIDAPVRGRAFGSWLS